MPESRARSLQQQKNCYVEEASLINKIIQENDFLIKLAAPYVSNLADMVAGTGFLGILTNHEGYILQTVGDIDLMENADSQFIKAGAIRKESLSGTNAIGLCLIHKQPIQTFSAEHYNIDFYVAEQKFEEIIPLLRLLNIIDIIGRKKYSFERG